jgi:hypothetical protein
MSHMKSVYTLWLKVILAIALFGSIEYASIVFTPELWLLAIVWTSYAILIFTILRCQI